MRARLRLLVSLALVDAVGVLAVLPAEGLDERTSFHVLDVGQGDASLLRAGAADVLVDAGPDASVLRQLGRVRPAWDRTVEVLVLTHPQADHIAGALPLLERERVGLILLPRVAGASQLFRAVIERAIKNNVRVRFVRAGQRLSAGRISLTVLAPEERALRLAAANTNEGSVVLRVEDRRGVSLLLTGDIERRAEQILVDRLSEGLKADILKVPHHGSRTSTSLRLLRAADPSVSIVSVGAQNRFGHPHEAILRRLAPRLLLRTDTHGTVSFLTDGEGNTLLKCERGCGAALGGSRR